MKKIFIEELKDRDTVDGVFLVRDKNGFPDVRICNFEFLKIINKVKPVKV